MKTGTHNYVFFFNNRLILISNTFVNHAHKMWRARAKLLVQTSLTRTRGMAHNVPTSPHELPRFGGIATMMRLPLQQGDPRGLDACFVGIPMDQGTSWRSGTRHGPRMIRNESNMMNQFHYSTGAAPFESLQVADIGDVPVNPYNVVKTIDNIKEFYGNILKENCIPLALGGDHTLTLGTLRAMGDKYGPVAMIQVDAHSDTGDTMFGEKIAHGTPFRRAVEDGVLDPKLSFQIGLRAYGYSPSDFKWSKEQVCHLLHLLCIIDRSMW